MSLTADQLLTVKDVAKTLQISPRTVYDNAHRLGGFYPAGLRVLRFPPGVILGYLSGQEVQVLGVSVPVSGERVRGQRIQDTPGSGNRKGEKEERSFCSKDSERHRI